MSGGRSCGWCASTALGRESWERRVLDGEPITSVARDTPFSKQAAQRHLRNHLNAEQLTQMRRTEAATLSLADFADRLLSLADEAADIRATANDPRSKLFAIKQEREALVALASRLGIDSEESIEVVHEARALAISVSSVLRDRPDVAAKLADDLIGRGEHDLASAFGRLADAGELRAIARVSSAKELAQ